MGGRGGERREGGWEGREWEGREGEGGRWEGREVGEEGRGGLEVGGSEAFQCKDQAEW